MERKRGATERLWRSEIIQANWGVLIPDNQWRIFHAAMEALRKEQISFLFGGALAVATYTERLRNTKDGDLFIRPEHKEHASEILKDAGFQDFYSHLAYDRSWIFRGVLEDVLVDLIWTTPNHVVSVDGNWFKHAARVMIREQEFRVIPPEELIFIKLYVVQRDRCDWPDLINVLRTMASRIDWPRLLDLVGDDLELLRGLLTVFCWVCPQAALSIPSNVRRELHLHSPPERDLLALEQSRVKRLDSRPWYSAFQPEIELMKV